MANVNVTYEELQAQASRFDAGRDEMQGVLDRLMREVESLTSSGFVTDQASVAFQDSYQQFTSGTTSAVNGIDGMSSFLRRAADTLAQVDAELAGALG